MAVVGAIGNAVFASIVPVLVGEGFNILTSESQDLSRLGSIALIIVGSQVVRGILQLGRNFGSEWLGQRIERDVRSELYANLLGKSIIFSGDVYEYYGGYKAPIGGLEIFFVKNFKYKI